MAGLTVTQVFGVCGDGKVLITWAPMTGATKIRLVWNSSRLPTSETDGTFDEITTDAATAHSFQKAFSNGTAVWCTVYAFNGSIWGTPMVGLDDGTLNANGSSYGNQYGAGGTVGVLGNIALGGTALDQSGQPLPNGTRIYFINASKPLNNLYTFGTSSSNYIAVDSVSTGVNGGFVDQQKVDPQNPPPAISGDFLWAGDILTITIKDGSNVQLYDPYNYTLTPEDISIQGFGPNFTLHPMTVQKAVEVLMPLAPTVVAFNQSEPEINPSPVSTVTPSFVWAHSPDRDNAPNAGKVDYAVEYSNSALPGTPAPHASTPPTYFLYKTIDSASRTYFQYREKSGGAWGVWTAWGSATEGYKMAVGATEAQIKFTVPTGSGTELTEGTWYWRVYVTDRTPI